MRSLGRVTALPMALLAVALAALAVLLPAAAGRAASQQAAAITRPILQLVKVTANSSTAQKATVQVYQRAAPGKSWVLVFGPWTGWVGYNGIAAAGAKREGDGKTPSGTYGFGFFFGVNANPGVKIAYRIAHTYNYWDDDPRSPLYNEWVDKRTQNAGRNPEPMHNVPAYNYGAVIAYNTARTPGLGSAIFLHVSTGGPTAGCVSLPQSQLLKILRWLSPVDNAQIAIAVK